MFPSFLFSFQLWKITVFLQKTEIESTPSADSLTVSVQPRVQLHTSTFVRTLKITNTGSYTTEEVLLVEFMYLAFTRMAGESYRRRLRSLVLYLCYIFRALINSLVC